MFAVGHHNLYTIHNDVAVAVVVPLSHRSTLLHKGKGSDVSYVWVQEGRMARTHTTLKLYFVSYGNLCHYNNFSNDIVFLERVYRYCHGQFKFG